MGAVAVPLVREVQRSPEYSSPLEQDAVTGTELGPVHLSEGLPSRGRAGTAIAVAPTSSIDVEDPACARPGQQ